MRALGYMYKFPSCQLICVLDMDKIALQTCRGPGSGGWGFEMVLLWLLHFGRGSDKMEQPCDKRNGWEAGRTERWIPPQHERDP